MKRFVHNGTTEDVQNLHDIASRMDELPSPPPVATQVLSMALGQDLGAKEIARTIEADQALAVKVLQAANSPIYGYPGRVATLEQAVVVLGLPTLQQILLSIVVRESLLETADLTDPVLAGIWRHSLACAVAAELLAKRARSDLAPLAFTAGLVHDCGKTLLFSIRPSEYEAVMDFAHGRPDSITDIEVRHLGMDHCRAGAELLSRWGMPPALIDAASMHHLPAEAMDSVGKNADLLRLVRLADLLSRRMTGGPDLESSARDEAMLLAEDLGLDDNEINAARTEMENRYAQSAAMFDLDEDSGAIYLRLLQRAKSRLSDTGLKLQQATVALDHQAALQLACMHAGLTMARAKTVQEVFAAALEALRSDVGMNARHCGVFRLDDSASILDGRFVEDGKTHLVACRTDERRLPCASAAEAGVPPLFLDIFSTYPARIPPDGKAPEALSPAYHEHFYIMPLVCEGEHFGELILEPSANENRLPGGAVPDAAALGQLASLTAFAVRRLDVARHRDERAYRLARALRTIKEMQLQAIQNQRLAAVGQLAAGAAHEINNPLAIVYARTQLLEQNESDPRRKKNIGQMKEQIERITKILKNLMEFARPDPPSFQPMDANAVIDKVVELIRGGLDKTNIELRLDLAPDLPSIQGDPRQIEQVLLNLLLNAIHAMENTGGVLRIVSTSDTKRGEIMLSVVDQGPGIAPEHRDKLFDPFFTTKEEGKGSGLGLSTSYGIVQSHGGAITVRSEPGEGATFNVHLPLRRPAAGQARRPVPAPLEDGNAVLVVDDEEHIREILKESLEAAGYAVHTAANGREGLKKLRKRRYRLLLLDIRMPEKSGLSLLSEIGDELGDTPVIMLTGLAGPEEVREAKALGASRCIQKPFQIDSLLQAVKETLERVEKRG
ncbi:histidine kinase [Oceanidesulfovibrio indonesiensis]|uniref:histidine kinase n=1 Tax=Oceanidesulfovibrio indonesiensis TaxID=54767 RepID=A0A7M3MDZ4_9BACT|nr:HDOD domain-containing protein [Oceanidesulfovibrio indonesiensis]TVM16941.1 histidine kinase [Oceanidesulfovibrio indonesiensis]